MDNVNKYDLLFRGDILSDGYIHFEYSGITAIIGFVLLLAGLFLPWISITIPILGEVGYSILGFLGLIRKFEAMYGLASGGSGIYLTLVLNVIAIITSFIAIFKRPISLISGIAGLLAGIVWLARINTLKSQIAFQMPKAGQLMSRFIEVGSGTFITIMGSLIMLLAFILWWRESKLGGSDDSTGGGS